MLNAIGIRQGRLSLPVPALPASWKAEFELARTCGFPFIEWLFAARGFEENPVWTDRGQAEIRERMEATGTGVVSLCADYFIANPLIRVSASERRDRAGILARLISCLAAVGGRVLVVPVLEGAAIRERAEMIELRNALDGPLEVAAAHHIMLALETDLPATELRALVEHRLHPSLGVCYDTGNSAAQGCDVAHDIAVLAPHLAVVHIKDRLRNGISVRLDQGAADFGAFCAAAAAAGYTGPLVLETPVGNDPMNNAVTDRRFLVGLLRDTAVELQ